MLQKLLADKQVLSCTMSLHIMSLQTHPSIPPFASFFFFEINMHPLKLHLDGPRVWSQSARLLKRRNKDISPQQPCCSCKHLHTLEKKQVLLLVFIANLECTVNLKPLILSVCSSFHHIFAELFIFYIFFWENHTDHEPALRWKPTTWARTHKRMTN